MFRTTKFCLLPLSVALLMAGGDASWRTKPLAQWNEEDAKQILASSPWVKKAVAAIIPERSEAQLRDGGRMGGGEGMGLDALDASILTGIGGTRQRGKGAGTLFSEHGALVVRWESALPVRTAELKAGEGGAPDWDGEYYAIAVYDVPGLSSADPKSLAGELKKAAALKRDGKKDVK